MGKRQGRWCCECDFCAVSDCDGKGAHVVFLTDNPQTHNYYQFCGHHRSKAEAEITRYLAEHPGVGIDRSNGAGSIALVLEAWPDFAGSAGVRRG